MAQASRGRRRGEVFGVRLTPEERATLERYQRAGGGPRALGAWMRWRALTAGPVGTTSAEVVPEFGHYQPAPVLPGPGSGTTATCAARSGTTGLGAVDEVVPDLAVALPRNGGAPRPGSTSSIAAPPIAERLILDLCGGSGAWSAPYREAGYPVELVTLPVDVRLYRPPPCVWGVLAAPPCTAFSRARGEPSEVELLEALSVVDGCLRVVLLSRPRWWALENPVGRLWRYLGTPRDTWNPCDFGDAWTKQTSVWGDYELPKRGPFVAPRGGMDARDDAPPGSTVAARRAVTPAGYARAFFEANP